MLPAVTIADMNLTGYRLPSLLGVDRGSGSTWVNGNGRLTFEFREGNVVVLDDEDYH